MLYHAQGDALYSMELALSLEKLNFIKLRELHRVAANAEDAQLADYIGECFPAQVPVSVWLHCLGTALDSSLPHLIMAAAPNHANHITCLCQHMACDQRMP